MAIKVLPSFVSRDPDRLHRFEQEAQAAAALNHPNILAVYQFGVFGVEKRTSISDLPEIDLWLIAPRRISFVAC